MPIFHRKSRWQRLLENLDSVSKNLASGSKLALKAGATAAAGVAALYRGERGRLVLPSEDERLRLPQSAGVRCRVAPRQRGRGVSVYEQNNLAAAKRASIRLDEYGRRLERFSNQPRRYARRRSGDYPGVGAWPPAGNPTAAPGGRHHARPGGPGLVLHCRPIPPCRHEFCDPGRDRRSYRRGSAVGACVSNPRRDTSPRHSKKAARIIAVRALSSAPACRVGSQRLSVHGCAPRRVNVLGPDLSAVGAVKQAGCVTS